MDALVMLKHQKKNIFDVILRLWIYCRVALAEGIEPEIARVNSWWYLGRWLMHWWHFIYFALHLLFLSNSGKQIDVGVCIHQSMDLFFFDMREVSVYEWIDFFLRFSIQFHPHLPFPSVIKFFLTIMNISPHL